MSDIKLRPCPFCGSENLKIYTTERNDRPKCAWRAEVVCLGCFGRATNHGFDWTEDKAKENAIKAWNRRANNEHDNPIHCR